VGWDLDDGERGGIRRAGEVKSDEQFLGHGDGRSRKGQREVVSHRLTRVPSILMEHMASHSGRGKETSFRD